MTADRVRLLWFLGLALLTLGRLGPVGSAQDAPTGRDQPADPDRDTPVSDLDVRYRFIEEYTTKEGREAEGAIGQYRVAFKETIDASFDRGQGAPERTRFTRQAIYTERPADVSTTDPSRVKSVVRHYETVVQVPDSRPSPSSPKLLDGLTIWFENRLGALPLVLVLSTERPLRSEEYRFATSHLFVPNLTALLPPLPTRVGDTWAIPTEAAQWLVGDLTRDSNLVGKLTQVRDDPKDTNRRLAVIVVTGRVMTIGGDIGVHAQIQFGFAPLPAVDREKEGDVPIEARGAIFRLSLAQAATGGLARPDDRLRRTTKRELILERQLAEVGDPLILPRTTPEETLENSWLTYVATNNQFHFRYPQELQLVPFPTDQNTLKLVRQRDEGNDVVMIRLVPKSALTPDEAFKPLFADWAKQKLEVQRGTTRTLDWPEMRVQRTEAVLKSGPQAPSSGERIHFDGYVVQTGRNASLTVEAMTAQDPPVAFRKDIEEMLKSFALDQPPTSTGGDPTGVQSKGERASTKAKP